MKGFVIDLDGTVYSGGRPIEGASLFFDQLNRSGDKYVILTNCPSRSRGGVVERLAGMGISTSEDHVLTSGRLAAMYLAQQGLCSTCVVGGKALEAELQEQGLEVNGHECDSVLVGWHSSIDCAMLQRAYEALRSGAALYATNPDPVIPGDSAPIIHTGTFTAMLEGLSGRKATVLGKPSPLIGPFVKSQLEGCDSIYVIGDSLDYDIAFASNNGYDGVLVMSGMTKDEDLHLAPAETRCILSIGEAVNLL